MLFLGQTPGLSIRPVHKTRFSSQLPATITMPVTTHFSVVSPATSTSQERTIRISDGRPDRGSTLEVAVPIPSLERSREHRIRQVIAILSLVLNPVPPVLP